MNTLEVKTKAETTIILTEQKKRAKKGEVAEIYYGFHLDKDNTTEAYNRQMLQKYQDTFGERFIVERLNMVLNLEFQKLLAKSENDLEIFKKRIEERDFLDRGKGGSGANTLQGLAKAITELNKKIKAGQGSHDDKLMLRELNKRMQVMIAKQMAGMSFEDEEEDEEGL